MPLVLNANYQFLDQFQKNHLAKGLLHQSKLINRKGFDDFLSLMLDYFLKFIHEQSLRKTSFIVPESFAPLNFIF